MEKGKGKRGLEGRQVKPPSRNLVVSVREEEKDKRGSGKRPTALKQEVGCREAAKSPIRKKNQQGGAIQY